MNINSCCSSAVNDLNCAVKNCNKKGEKMVIHRNGFDFLIVCKECYEKFRKE